MAGRRPFLGGQQVAPIEVQDLVNPGRTLDHIKDFVNLLAPAISVSIEERR